MTPQASVARLVQASWAMRILRGEAGKMQHWRRRLSTVYGPRKWVEFKAMYQGEIDAKRNELAGRIRRLRRSAGIGTRKMEWVAQ